MPRRSGPKHRQYSTAYKQAALQRLDRGEALAGVARDLGIARKLLYHWRQAWHAEGVGGLNRKRGPKPGLRERRLAAALAPPPDPSDGNAADGQVLKKAQARIAELERLVGRQQIDLDFFQRALQALDVSKTPPASAPASTRSSKR